MNNQKSGIIPYYIKNEKVFVLLMKPSNIKYGGDRYQIAKGNIDGDDTLFETAIKEGHEELGLKTKNIIDGVMYNEKTHISGKYSKYDIHTFYCKINDINDFDIPHYETGSTKWFREDELSKVRKNQKNIIKNSIVKIKGK